MERITANTARFCGLAVVLAALFLVQTRLAQRSWSVTFDETFYLNCAIQTVQDRWIDKRLSQSGVGALPVLLTIVPAAAAAPTSDRPKEWIGQLEDPPINLRARRLNSALIGVPLVLFVAGWLCCRRGLLAAAVGGAMLAFSPSLLAHASLATTDACFALFSLISVAVLAKWFNQPTTRNYILAGISIGLAVSSKYSGIFLFPVSFLLLVGVLWPETTGSLAWRGWVVLYRSAIRALGLFAIAMTIVWATDGFSFTGPLKTVPLEETPPDSPWIRILGDGPWARQIMDYSHRTLRRPSIVGAVISRWLHNRTGHPAFLHGEHSTTGWFRYFPSAWLWKSTPAELLLTLAVFPLLWISWRKNQNEQPGQRRTRFVWLLAIGVFWMMVCSARVNIGQRYLLALYPLTILLAIDLIWLVWQNRPRWLAFLSVVLLGVQVFSAVWVSPHYLAYFSPLVGGPREGWHYLADSNMDWGEDLPALSKELQMGGFQAPLLEYFGTAEPKAYGINAVPFAEVRLEDLSRHDVLAISVTRLQAVYGFPIEPFREFRGQTPIAKAGYSIFLYDLTTPAAQAMLRSAWEQYPPAFRKSSEDDTPMLKPGAAH